ncbi:hypothetical protein BV902_02235 [Sphingobacterium sp. B29]|uniref:acyltransferase n=1 Tax=Sphingobacterium sp. B29 TaxID=1933220 RepID=UPI0009587320|nr:acyltransferase [Sphingobacterium sp. B29]APU95295.1 hypothetical protein BV902_02235 [Sphingobacterium sp. B29]
MMKLLKFKRKIASYMYVLINLILVKMTKGIKVAGKLRLIGPIFIDIKDGGTLIIGDNLQIISGLMINPLGRNINSTIRIDENATVTLGNNVGMSNVCLWAKNEIVIGNNVKIGADTIIFDSDMHSMDHLLRRDILTDSSNAKSKSVHIGEDVFIGTRCIIMKGVSIGSRSIIAAGSVVVTSIPADEIWGGNPAKFLKKAS